MGKGGVAWRTTGRGSPSHYSRIGNPDHARNVAREGERGIALARGNRWNNNKLLPPGTSDVVCSALMGLVVVLSVRLCLCNVI